MEITITKQYRPRGISNTYNYKTITNAGTVYVPTPPAVISFVQNANPSVLNYQEDYAALYGPYPRVILLTLDPDSDDNMLERADVPKRVMVADVLDSIVWDLGYEDSGIILLYPTQ